jgi:CspA family cold shock protein
LAATFVYEHQALLRFPLKYRFFGQPLSLISVEGDLDEPWHRKLIERLDSTKGYVFIQPDDGSTDGFVEISAVELVGKGLLQEGQKVSYEIARDRRPGKSSADDLRAG